MHVSHTADRLLRSESPGKVQVCKWILLFMTFKFGLLKGLFKNIGSIKMSALSGGVKNH